MNRTAQDFVRVAARVATEPSTPPGSSGRRLSWPRSTALRVTAILVVLSSAGAEARAEDVPAETPTAHASPTPASVPVVPSPSAAIASPTLLAPTAGGSLAAGGRLRVQVESAGQRYDVAVEVGGRTFRCVGVTIDKPCALTDLPQGPGVIRVSGSSSFVKDIGISDWPTRVRIDRAGYGPLFGGILIAGLGVGLIAGTQVGSVGSALGSGFVAGGTTMVIWDIGRNHDVVKVEADSLAAWRAPNDRARVLGWRFCF